MVMCLDSVYTYTYFMILILRYLFYDLEREAVKKRMETFDLFYLSMFRILLLIHCTPFRLAVILYSRIGIYLFTSACRSLL